MDQRDVWPAELVTGLGTTTHLASGFLAHRSFCGKLVCAYPDPWDGYTGGICKRCLRTFENRKRRGWYGTD